MAAYICDVTALGSHGCHSRSTFNCERPPHAASDTKTGQAFLRVAADHLMQQRHQDSAARGSDRVTNGDGPAVDIDLGGIPSHLTVHPDCLRGKCFVNLHQVEIPVCP